MLKSIKLLLKNAFRSSTKNKAQIIGMSLLVMLVSLIVSILFAVNSRVVKAYNNLNTLSNLRDVVVDVNLNNEIKEDQDKWDKLSNYNILDENNNIKKLPHEKLFYQQYIMHQLALKNNLYSTYTEARLFSSLKNEQGKLKIKVISKIYSDNLVNGVDKLIVEEGDIFSEKDENNFVKKEVVIGESYAKKNKIKIGEIIRIQPDEYGEDFLVKNTTNEKLKNDIKENPNGYFENLEYANQLWFKVVGIGSSSDFISPILDRTSVMPNVNNEILIYINPYFFGYDIKKYTFSDKKNPNNSKRDLSMGVYLVQESKLTVASENDREVYFSLKGKEQKINDEIINQLNKDYKEYLNIKQDINYFYDSNDSKYVFSGRIKTFNSIMSGYQIMSISLIIVIGVIAGFTTILTAKKQVELQSKQIGCLKSLGYRKREVVNNFAAIPLIVSIIGSITGYLLSLLLEVTIIGIFSKYFSIAFYGFKFNLFSFIFSIVILWLAFTLLVFSIGYWTIRQPALTLLKGGDDKIINKFAIGVKSLVKKRSFDNRLRVALLTTSFGKLIGVSATMLLSATLISTTVIAPKVMRDNMVATFNGMNYQNMVEYNQPLSNNPWSFYKTYNPDYREQNNTQGGYDEWGFDKGKSPLEIKLAGRDPFEVNSAYPRKENNKPDIDWEKIIKNDLLKANINSKYYLYDIPLSDLVALGELSYLNWKNTSLQFLLNLNEIESGISIILKPLQSQWPDYVRLTEMDIPNLLKDNNEKSKIKEYSKIMLKVYSKYIQGLKLKISNNMFDKPNDENKGQLDINKIKKRLNKIFKNSKIEKLYQTDNDFSKSILKFINPENGSISIEINNKKRDLRTISEKEIDGINDEDLLKKINAILTYWFGATLDGRIGMAILQTTYTRAPYFVQENMKKAMEKENGEYNVTFNIVPFNPESEVLGTLLNTTFVSKNNKTEKAKIFGIKPENTFLNLKNNKNENLENLIFDKKENQNSIPIIINQSLYKKINKKVGETISLKVFKENLYKSNQEKRNKIDLFKDVKYGHDEESGKDPKNDFKDFRTQFSYLWYTNSDGYASNSIGGLKASTIFGKKIAGESAAEATKPTQIYKAYKNGELIVDNELTDTEFKIVGVQNGYGQPQGWISNDNANQILNYDKIKVLNFFKWFAREYPEGNPIYKIEDFNDSELEKFINKAATLKSEDYKDYEKIYNDFIKKSDANQKWANMNKLYENLFPIFNYKYSNGTKFHDIEDGFSVSQKFGDYGTIGLNGNYEVKNTNKEGEPEIDFNNFNEGYGIGSLSTMLPKEQTRLILGQVTDIVNMIILLFIIIAIIVSTTIIILTTSLIIYENKQFIATMKILGYSDKYVVRQILGMYISPILIMYVIGFVFGWFVFKLLANILALNTAWVLPVQFSIILPIVVFLIIGLIYLVTFGIGWKNIQKINPLEALKDND